MDSYTAISPSDLTLEEYTAQTFGDEPVGGALADIWEGIKTATLKAGSFIGGVAREGYETGQAVVSTIYGDVVQKPLETVQLILILLAVAIILLVIYNPGFLKGVFSLTGA